VQGANNATWAMLAEGGTINNLAGATYDMQGSVIADYSGANTFNNAGLLEKSSDARGYSSINIPFNNTGTVEVDSGTLSISDLTNYSSGTLTGGTYVVDSDGMLVLPGAVTRNAAVITVNGAGASFSGLSALTANAGTLNLLNGASLSIAAGLENSGTINIDPSTLTVNGDFTQAGDGVLNITLDGTGVGQSDLLDITGTAYLAGTLDITFADGYHPGLGDSFQILNYAAISGTFDAIDVLGAPGYQFTPQYTGSGLLLTTTAVPEPAALMLLAVGGLGLLCRRRRRMA
ncbi:MAG: PEP-CTERM sorting domain-containing protein, partial [Planctomycetia bacterium]|nr:PEP-CTERM sorting domain-containing protein [Planctomycetia bacterium]